MSGDKGRILHFSIGPVQGFIADARRLRDFWAGSFLLSWLAGQAMKAVVENGGTIVFPEVKNDELFDAIDGKGGTPWVGSLPNRFKATVPGDFDPQECVKAVTDAWRDLAEKVWNKFVADVAQYGKNTRKIWDRQVNNFWEITWVLGDDPGDGSDSRWLDQRKNWRTHWQEDEESDLCTLMGHYQELSGFKRIHERQKQDDFWMALSEQRYRHLHTDHQRRVYRLNLRLGERLCAIALIKRLYPLIANKTVGWWPGGNNLSTINWPSTSYIAAVPWLKRVEESVSEGKWTKYPELINKWVKELSLEGAEGETDTYLFGLPDEDFFNLDGHLLHEDGIHLWVKDSYAPEGNRESMRNDLLQAYAELRKASGGRPSEFYAILKMDGDRIGAKIGNPKTANEVKEGLANFTKAVKDYFDPNGSEKNKRDGVLVYAGGDDVLAFLPVYSAIDAAYDLRKLYDKAFRGAKNPADYTMSAAIVFTHFKNPLRHALEKAEHYLDAVAKEKNGRDSLALAVMKPGGIAFDWVSCWEKGGVKPGCVMMDVAKKAIGGEDAEYSTGLLYNLRERYKPLLARSDEDNGDEKGNESNTFLGMITSLLVAEYKKQPGKTKTPNEQAEAAITPLLTIGRPLKRNADGSIEQSKHFNFDAALIARFIAVEGFCHLPRKKDQREEAAA